MLFLKSLLKIMPNFYPMACNYLLMMFILPKYRWTAIITNSCRFPPTLCIYNGLLTLNVISQFICIVLLSPEITPNPEEACTLYKMPHEFCLLATVHSLKKILSSVTFQLLLKISNVSSLPLPRSFHLGLSF